MTRLFLLILVTFLTTSSFAAEQVLTCGPVAEELSETEQKKCADGDCDWPKVAPQKYVRVLFEMWLGVSEFPVVYLMENGLLLKEGSFYHLINCPYT